MRITLIVAAVVGLGISLAGCMTDEQYANSTPQERKADCTNTKVAGAVTGIPGGLIGAGVGYMLMSRNRSCDEPKSQAATK